MTSDTATAVEWLNVEKDIVRFSSAHSWYKHLSLKNPSQFYMMCARGLQPGNERNEQTDDGQLHWYFFRDFRCITGFKFKDSRVVEIIKRNSVALNPFIYRNDSAFEDRIHHFITEDPHFEAWLQENGFQNATHRLRAHKQQCPDDYGIWKQPFAKGLKESVGDTEY
jgi:hypothetical protein